VPRGGTLSRRAKSPDLGNCIYEKFNGKIISYGGFRSEYRQLPQTIATISIFSRNGAEGGNLNDGVSYGTP